MAVTKPPQPRTVFVSYSKKWEGGQIDILHKGLLERRCLPSMVPHDVTGGSDIAYQIGATNSNNNLLLVCLSEESLGQDWINKQGIKEKVLVPLGEKISELGIVKLDDSVQIPKFLTEYKERYAQHYREFHIPYNAEVAQVEQALDTIATWVNPEWKTESYNGSRSVQQPPGGSLSAYYPVSGVFAVDNPDLALLRDLRRQIARGEVDQKYLYWDAQGATRWVEIADRSTYQTAQMAQSLLGTKGGDIVRRIIEDAGKSGKLGFRFINLGVGIGWKDRVILMHLLEQTKSDIGYVAVDQSFAIMQITIQRLEPLMILYGQRLHMHYIVDDFLANADRFNEYINTQVTPRNSCRIIGFLGGSLGNFRETNILTTMREMMSPQDYLLLGVEYIGARSDTELQKIYSDEVMRQFWSGPIRDVQGTDIQEFDFQFPMFEGHAYSDVENAKTIVARVAHKKKRTQVQVCWMTKYEPDDLELFLRRQGFTIVEKYVEGAHTPPWFGKYILKVYS